MFSLLPSVLLRSGAVSDEQRDGVKKREGATEGEKTLRERHAGKVWGGERKRKTDEEPHCECCLRMFTKAREMTREEALRGW